MDTLARVVAITVQPSQIQPCLRINRGIYVASTELGATFSVEVSFTYNSGGATVGPVVGRQIISATHFRQILDERSVRSQGAAVAIRSQPDAGTAIFCTAKIIITDRSGAVIECGSADSTSFPAP